MSNEDSRSKEFLDTLMGRRTVVLPGSIERESIGEVIVRMMTLQMRSTDRINLIIDSGGGNTWAALQLCDVMTHLMTAPVRGIAVGNCHSAATFVMLHCVERICTPHTRFVIHSGTMSKISIPMNETTERNLEELLAQSKTTTELVIKLYMEKLKKTRPEVEKLIGRGDQDFNGALTATEAVEIGLIERIIEGKLDIFPGAIPDKD